jgi:hypothetical protein
VTLAAFALGCLVGAALSLLGVACCVVWGALYLASWADRVTKLAEGKLPAVCRFGGPRMHTSGTIARAPSGQAPGPREWGWPNERQ